MNTKLEPSELLEKHQQYDPNQLIKVKEACELLSISTGTFYSRLVKEGHITLRQIAGVGVSRVRLGDVYSLVEDRLNHDPEQLPLPGMEQE